MRFFAGFFRRIDANVTVADFLPLAGVRLGSGSFSGFFFLFTLFFSFFFRFLQSGPAGGTGLGRGFGFGGGPLGGRSGERSEPTECDKGKEEREEAADESRSIIIFGGRLDRDVHDMPGVEQDPAEEGGLPQKQRPQAEGFEELRSPRSGNDALIEEIGDGGEMEQGRTTDGCPGTPAVAHFGEEFAGDPVPQSDRRSDPDQSFVAVDLIGPEMEEGLAPKGMSPIHEHQAVEDHEEREGSPEAITPSKIILAVGTSPEDEHGELGGREEEERAVPASEGEGTEIEEPGKNGPGPFGEFGVVVAQEGECDRQGDSRQADSAMDER